MNRYRIQTPAILASVALGLALLGGVAGAQNIERVRLTDNDLNCQQIYAEAQQMETLARLPAQGTAPPSLEPILVAVVPTPAPAADAPPQFSGLFGALAGVAASRSGSPGAAQLFGGMAGVAAPAVPVMTGLPNDMQGLMNDQATREVLLSPNMQQSIARARAAGMSDAQIMATIQPSINARRAALAAWAPAPVAPVYNSQNAMPAAQVQGSYTAGVAYAPQAANYAAQAPKSMGQQAQARKDQLTQMFLNKGCKVADIAR